jgi:hypothetical protein
MRPIAVGASASRAGSVTRSLELDMHDATSPEALRTMAVDAFARREAAGAALAEAAERLAGACRDMAVRFLRGGKLLALVTVARRPTRSTSPSSSCTRSSSASARCLRCRW